MEPAKPKHTPKKTEKPDQAKAKPKQQENSGKRDRDNDADEEERPEASSCSTSRHSFDPATLVLMADGSTRPISEVSPGDEVQTKDPATGEKSARPVTLLHVNRDLDLVDVTVSDRPADRVERGVGQGKGDRSTRGPTGSVLHTTEHHPFWDATTGEWVDAADLIPGTSTLVGPDGEIQYITAVHHVTGAKIMRDLTVADIHTYYVLAGTTPVLVHNCGGREPDHADSCRCANGAAPRPAVQEHEVGRFGDLDGRSRVRDDLTPNHIPQAASGRIDNYRDYAAHMMKDADHRLTRTYGGAGRRTARLDAGLTNRQVVARDLWDLRSIGQKQYGDPSYFNEDIKGILNYYRSNNPDFLER